MAERSLYERYLDAVFADAIKDAESRGDRFPRIFATIATLAVGTMMRARLKELSDFAGEVLLEREIRRMEGGERPCRTFNN